MHSYQGWSGAVRVSKYPSSSFILFAGRRMTHAPFRWEKTSTIRAVRTSEGTCVCYVCAIVDRVPRMYLQPPTSTLYVRCSTSKQLRRAFQPVSMRRSTILFSFNFFFAVDLGADADFYAVSEAECALSGRYLRPPTSASDFSCPFPFAVRGCYEGILQCSLLNGA